ncbi:Transport protein, major facilitator superfamily (MFS) [Lactiplantibacillus plantarum]|nr:Transport protein, major facilitator superfamily (MFS) [Lactiplantibacillus plantarum]MCG0791510.1 Transport protein, major facilitator superfamily (MFS) [Lactiplantibacillus plantarum]
MAIKQPDLTINISNHQSSLQIFKAAASNFISSLSGKMFTFACYSMKHTLPLALVST